MPRLCLLLVFLAMSICQSFGHDDETKLVFALGNKDSSFREFSRQPLGEKKIVFEAGTSHPDLDWPAYQPGSFDHFVSRSTMERDWTAAENSSAPEPAFEIGFQLSAPPAGTFVLHLDAILRHRRPAVPKLAIVVNGKVAGSYRLDAKPSPELWWPNGGEGDGNLQYFGYASLDVTLPYELFIHGRNVLSLKCIDGFGIFYDYLSLSHGPGTLPSVIASLSPTVLFKKTPSGLVELATLRIRSTRLISSAQARVTVGDSKLTAAIHQREPGDFETVIEVPDFGKPVTAEVYLSGSSSPIYKGQFIPKRKWKVFALPMEQADFGYNDLPARTLEWENRFIDRTLEIQRKFPAYSFTLDASANLESYLLTRDEKHGKELLGHLQSDKWGINALYANYFTGLMSPEELYRSLEYAQTAGKRFGFKVDSASQTDEPSISWGVAQVLSDTGIKYFTNGSDPIRGALNPIGLLNFHSPFFWEVANGSKILVWSGVSYTAIDDMTWAGWDMESARSGEYKTSIFGLSRSLPLFLSQYERENFPFDAVMLFGLHNDEIPMRHWGDADVIDMWNREYAYPQIIPATQRDFFQHITRNFSNKIDTIRGDGGAYWEDEAGADARIASMLRTAQSQLVAAEKFESVAGWLNPHLKYDPTPFDVAWKNILLADSYVWSDANSFRRPESYRTRAGEAAHRAWAEAALQQTSDLRLVAMDKVAELVQSDRQGAVVFNPDSWERSDLFDFELEADETLVDPATNQAIPCGVTASVRGYHQVRCWAAEVPAVGYKFYATAKGEVQEGQQLALSPSMPTVENEHYKLMFDTKTGAMTHLQDKETGRDLVDTHSDYGMNEYLYVSGGDPGSFLKGSLKDNRILAADVTLPLPKLEVHRAAIIEHITAQKFPWGTQVTVHSQAENTPAITSTITLLDAVKQISIVNDIVKTATLRKEAVYFAFPFGLSEPQLKYQSATAWVDPQKDMLPGANLQWFTTQGGVWADGRDNSIAFATADAPLVTFQDINRGLWPTRLNIVNGTVFSYAMNNYWYTDTPAQQGGRFSFRYALTSGPAATQDLAGILASAQRSPLFAIKRYNMGWNQKLPTQGISLASASPASARILTIRSLEAPATYLVRIQNTSSDSSEVKLTFGRVSLQDAYLSSPMGEQIAPAVHDQHTVSLTLDRNDIKSVVIKVSPSE